MFNFVTLPVKKFVICDDEENVYHALNALSFADTVDLLRKIRAENPDFEYAMYAEIDA